MFALYGITIKNGGRKMDKIVMDRRRFIRVGAAVTIAAKAGQNKAMAAAAATTTHNPETIILNDTLIGLPDKLAVRFLGTGAADWSGPDSRGEHRRLTSILLENAILVDFTPSDMDMLPVGAVPEVIFYTHSHGDHYNPEAALKAGVKTVLVGMTWLERAKGDFEKASSKNDFPMPQIIGISVGDTVKTGGISFTALPANHATSDPLEQTLMFLIEKGPVRLLYATDTGGIPVIAARLAGIDAHVNPGKPVTALIMEATMGLDYNEDYRIFTHSSVGDVLRTYNVLSKTGRYAPLSDYPVYLTHLARTLHGTQAELNEKLPSPLKAAFDGLEVLF